MNYDNITENEYNEALEKLPLLKDELFKIRYEMEIHKKDINLYDDLTKRLKAHKHEITKNLIIITQYEKKNNIEKGDDENEKHKRK